MQKNMLKNNIIITPMQKTHLDDVANIEREVFLNPWTAEMYGAELEKDYSDHYVLLDNDNVVGYYGFFSTEPDAVEVTNVAITGDYQGKGLGNMILEHMIDASRDVGATKIFLETRDTNYRAQSLYEKYGFKLINIRKKYYDGVEDARIYMRED